MCYILGAMPPLSNKVDFPLTYCMGNLPGNYSQLLLVQWEDCPSASEALGRINEMQIIKML